MYPESNYILLTDDSEPESFKKVQPNKDKKNWVKTMLDEINSLKKNKNYELVELPKGK